MNLLLHGPEFLRIDPDTASAFRSYEQLPGRAEELHQIQPVQCEEFADCLSWWNNREENGHAWRVPGERIIENGYNLDIKNPTGKDDFEHLPPGQLVENIVRKEQRILEIMVKFGRSWSPYPIPVRHLNNNSGLTGLCRQVDS